MYKAEFAHFSQYKALYTIKYDEYRPVSRLGSVKKFGSFRQTPRNGSSLMSIERSLALITKPSSVNLEWKSLAGFFKISTATS